MKQPIKTGAMSLLLCVVVLCLVTLSVLTFSTAHADYSIAERQAENVTESYEAENDAQLWLAEVKSAVKNNTAYPDGTEVNGQILSTDAGDTSGHYIHAEVDISTSPCRVICWEAKNNMGERDTLDDLYTG